MKSIKKEKMNTGYLVLIQLCGWGGVYLLLKKGQQLLKYPDGSQSTPPLGNPGVDSVYRVWRVLEHDTNQTGLISPVESINV